MSSKRGFSFADYCIKYSFAHTYLRSYSLLQVWTVPVISITSSNQVLTSSEITSKKSCCSSQAASQQESLVKGLVKSTCCICICDDETKSIKARDAKPKFNSFSHKIILSKSWTRSRKHSKTDWTYSCVSKDAFHFENHTPHYLCCCLSHSSWPCNGTRSQLHPTNGFGWI